MFLLGQRRKHISFPIIFEQIVEMRFRKRGPRAINILHPFRRRKTDFGGGNTYDGAIFLVKSMDGEGTIAIEFMIDNPPLSEGSEFWTRDFREWRENETFDSETGGRSDSNCRHK